MNVVDVIESEINRLYILDSKVCSYLHTSANKRTILDVLRQNEEEQGLPFRSPREDIERLQTVLSVPGVYSASLQGNNVEVNIYPTASWDEVDPLLRALFAEMPVATQQDWS